MFAKRRMLNSIPRACAVLIAAASTTASWAQDEPLRHVLGRHAFLPSLSIPSSFTDTRSTLGVGMGYGNFSQAQLGGLTDLKVGAFAPQFEVQASINKWWAIILGGNGNVSAGLNTESALQYGATTSYSWKFGLIARILRDEKFNLALAVQLNRPHILAISPLEQGVQKVQSLLGAASSDFPTNGVQTEWVPTTRMAYGFNAVWGLQSILGFSFQSGDELSPKRTGNRFLIGLGASVDLNPAIHWPLGLTANYRRGQVISGGVSNADTFLFGLYETAGTSVNMGLEFGFTTQGSRSTSIGSLVARAYYN